MKAASVGTVHAYEKGPKRCFFVSCVYPDNINVWERLGASATLLAAYASNTDGEKKCTCSKTLQDEKNREKKTSGSLLEQVQRCWSNRACVKRM
jgi:hypothetical protein